MTTGHVTIGRLAVANELDAFVRTSLSPGSGVDPAEFYKGLEELLVELQPRAVALLAQRDDLQAQIDQWHVERKGQPHNPEAYQAFLTEIGYLVPAPDTVAVQTANVDPEIASIAGPQLVVPVDNARYALNAANARWGSLYDALYGTDVIPEDDGADRSGAYNPVRGNKVIAFGRDLLDAHAPLASGSHAEAASYRVQDGQLAVTTSSGHATGLLDPAQFVAFRGEAADPSGILLTKHGLHLEIQIDRSHNIGSSDAAGVADIAVESALSTIMDCEDSVATVDAADKVGAYSNWLGLMTGTLSETFTKADKSVTRQLEADIAFTAPDGTPHMVRRRSAMLVRNVGLHLMNDMVTLDGAPVAETLLDACFTAWAAKHDIIGNSPHKNSPAGSVYIVKPKMHGPDEVAFATELFGAVEALLRLEPNTLKMGIMDEERRTSLSLSACIAAAADRVVFINTGFLDRTGDEIHTNMEAGPLVPKGEMKTQTWLGVYEDANVDAGLAAGLLGHGQIGKGMWARPDDMAAMMDEKVGHPKSGASCAWVPSPTAATLHALHYLDINVAEVQAQLAERQPANVLDMLIIPALEPGRELSPGEIATELENNAQGILGYVARWVGQGVGCSKVPDINDVGLMEDRATLRISSQLLANWLHHGILSEAQVGDAMARMAEVVDKQNAGDAEYQPMTPDLEHSIPFQAAMSLVLEGRDQANGYTEFLLTERRQKMKASQA